MIRIICEFFNSQLFGILFGAILTGGFTLFIDHIKYSKEEQIYTKRKRESLYQKMYDFSMRYEKDIRDNNDLTMSQETKDLWNEIQVESIFGKHETMETFYDLHENMQKNFKKSPNDTYNVCLQNNKEIVDFYYLIKQELGIKD